MADPTLTDEDLATLDKQLERGEFGGMAGTLRQVIAALRASREEVERLRELDDARHDLANARIDAAQYASDFWNTDRVLKTCREDLRIANEATLVLLATAAELTREVERLKSEVAGYRTVAHRGPM